MATCRVCKKDYIYDDLQGYDQELCSPLCDGIEIGRRSRDHQLQEARQIMQRYRECRKFGVGMLQGSHIYLDDDVDAFLACTGGDPLNPLRAIASQHSSDPVLSNIEQGVREGLAKAGKDSE